MISRSALYSRHVNRKDEGMYVPMGKYRQGVLSVRERMHVRKIFWQKSECAQSSIRVSVLDRSVGKPDVPGPSVGRMASSHPV